MTKLHHYFIDIIGGFAIAGCITHLINFNIYIELLILIIGSIFGILLAYYSRKQNGTK